MSAHAPAQAKARARVTCTMGAFFGSRPTRCGNDRDDRPPGTKGADTIVAITFGPAGDGALVKLTHAGFCDQASRDQHAGAWPLVLAQQDESIGSER